jgi:hypothetical protein
LKRARHRAIQAWSPIDSIPHASTHVINEAINVLYV